MIRIGFLFRVGCRMSTSIFDVPCDGVPMVDSTNLMGDPFVGLCAFNILYILGGTGSDGYAS